MQEIKYKFDVTDFFKLVNLLEACRPQLSQTFARIAEEKKKHNQPIKDLPEQEKLKFINAILEGGFAVLLTAENHVYELLASTTNQDIETVKKLSISNFIKQLKGLFAAINWDEILGELKTLIPEKYHKKIQEAVEEMKKQEEQPEQDKQT
jgi:hypothetical protein